jgi:hypothetical protein
MTGKSQHDIITLEKIQKPQKRILTLSARPVIKQFYFFFPKGESFFSAQIFRTQFITTPYTSYQQTFNFQLYIPGADMKKIWAASVEVSCDPGESKTAKEVSQKLLYSFKNNKYIQ